jgi:S-adenosylmethionine hydrolase
MRLVRPVTFLSDYGTADEFVGVVHGVIARIAPDARVIDIGHGVPRHGVLQGALTLARALPYVPAGVHLAVVDPEVGARRRAIALRTAEENRLLVGPDNGLLLPAARRLGGVSDARVIENRSWLLPGTSSTFHGRDIFAPAAAHLATGAPFADVGPEVDRATLVELAVAAATVSDGHLATEVVYVDSFGNLRLAGGVTELAAALGPVAPGTRLEVSLAESTSEEGVPVRWSRTFGEAHAGDLLAYEDSSGALAIAESSGNAAGRLGAGTGARIGIRRA